MRSRWITPQSESIRRKSVDRFLTEDITNAKTILKTRRLRRLEIYFLKDCNAVSSPKKPEKTNMNGGLWRRANQGKLRRGDGDGQVVQMESSLSSRGDINLTFGRYARSAEHPTREARACVFSKMLPQSVF